MAVLSVIGLVVATSTFLSRDSDVDRKMRAACAKQSQGMAAPWRFNQRPSAASTRAVLSRASLWTPPHDAAHAAAQRAEAAGHLAKAQRLRRIAAQPRGVWLIDTDPQ